MKFSIKNYAKYIIYGLAVVCLIFLFFYNYMLFPIKYKKEINLYSENYGVDNVLVASIICVESSFIKEAKSGKGAIGLMQIMPSTAKWICEQKGEQFDQQKLFSPDYNINIGTYYLKYLINKFGDVDNAIIAYNAGEGTVSNWLKNDQLSQDGKKLDKVPYSETSTYLTRVKRAMKVYAEKL